MAGQLNSFVQKFYSLWNTGNDACLNLECHAGKAQIHLQLNLQLQPQPQHQPRHHPPPPPQQPRRHLGPSQLRRRARRELARATAAEAANPAAENADDDAAHAPLAEQAQPPPNNGPQHAAAAQAGHLPAEQALPPFNHHKSVTQYVQTLNMLQLCKLGTCQLNKLSFPFNHHKSVTQYVRTMKHSLLHKSPPFTTSPTKTGQMPPSRTASSQHTMRLSDGTDYGAYYSSNATSKHKKHMTSHNTTKHCKKTSPYSHSTQIKSTQ